MSEQEFYEMDVRLFIEKGKLVDVARLDLAGLDVTEDRVKSAKDCTLPKETGIQQAFSVLTQHTNPHCLIWSIERSETGYKKVCLVWV